MPVGARVVRGVDVRLLDTFCWRFALNVWGVRLSLYDNACRCLLIGLEKRRNETLRSDWLSLRPENKDKMHI